MDKGGHIYNGVGYSTMIEQLPILLAGKYVCKY